MIKSCACKGDANNNTQSADYQTKKYGQGKRVHTVGGTPQNRKYKCTICGHVKS